MQSPPFGTLRRSYRYRQGLPRPRYMSSTLRRWINGGDGCGRLSSGGQRADAAPAIFAYAAHDDRSGTALGNN
jgi:hypothetical protein